MDRCREVTIDSSSVAVAADAGAVRPRGEGVACASSTVSRRDSEAQGSSAPRAASDDECDHRRDVAGVRPVVGHPSITPKKLMGLTVQKPYSMRSERHDERRSNETSGRPGPHPDLRKLDPQVSYRCDTRLSVGTGTASANWNNTEREQKTGR
jgi:hypothetical protein